MCFVDLPTGRLSLSEIDFQVPGRIPLIFKRHYRSTNIWLGDLGYGWSYPLGVCLWQEERDLVFRGADGRRIPFLRPTVDNPSIQPTDNIALHVVPSKELPWDVFLKDRTASVFMVQRTDEFTLFFLPITKGNMFPLRGIADGSGNFLLVVPGMTGLPSRIEDPRGRTLFLSHNRNSSLEEIRISENRDGSKSTLLVHYTYDRNGDLVAVENGGGVRKYEYRDHLLIKHQDRTGKITRMDFDDEGRCVWTGGPGGVLERRYQYDPINHSTTVYDSLGHPATYTYSETQKIVKTVDRAGGVSLFDYDAQNRLVRAIDQLGNETSICCGDTGAQAGKIRADGSYVAVDTDSDGQLTRMTSAGGAVTEYIRDATGRIVRFRLPRVGEHEVEYAPDGSVKKMRLPRGREVTFNWSPDGRTLTESDSGGILTKHYFDLNGRLLRFEDALGAVTRFCYDAAGHLAQIINPDGSVRRFVFDAEGKLTEMGDESGAVTQWKYDAAGRRVGVVVPSGDRIHCQYDLENRLIGIHYSEGLSHRYEYDKRGLVRRQEFSDGRVERYEFDARGLLLRLVDPLGSAIEVERDAVGRPTLIRYPDGCQKIIDYDDDGRWIRMERAGHHLERQLTPDGLPVFERQDDFFLKRKFGEGGELIELVDSFGRKVAYEYNEHELPVKVEITNGKWEEEEWKPISEPRVHQFKYDRVGNLMMWEMPSGKVEHRKYDLRSRLTEVSIHVRNQVIGHRQYEYDPLGRVVLVRDSRRGEKKFTYDVLNRIQMIQEDGRPEQHFEYSSNGDLVSGGLYYSQPHQVAGTPGHHFEYDQRGFAVRHISPNGTTRLSYTACGLIREAIFPAGPPAYYEYDPDSRWVKKVVGKEESRYYWKGDQLLAWQKGDSPPTNFLYLPGGWTPLEQEQDGQCYSIHSDHMGTVSELVDEQGQVVWSNPGGIWGEGRKQRTPGNGPNCIFGFPGQIWDAETGFFYNHYRFYFPETAHYLTPDPIGIWGGLDAYRYASDPVNQIDPLGLECRNKNDDPALYRGDRRPPEQICKEGFQPWKTSGTMSLADHVGGSNENSQWVSTAYDHDEAKKASKFGERYDDDIGPRAGRWVYEIENPGCGVEVDCDPEVQRREKEQKEEHGFDSLSESEIAFNKAIPPSNIVGAVNLDTGEIAMCP